MDAKDYALRNDLNVWRQKMLVDLGINDPFFGPALILPDPILTQIIDLSHHSKLSDVSALRDLTDWCYADEYGENVLVLVRNHYPPPAIVPAPQPNIQLTNTLPQAALDPSVLSTSVRSNTALKKPRKATVCSKCKQVGHNGMSTVVLHQSQLSSCRQQGTVFVQCAGLVPIPTSIKKTQSLAVLLAVASIINDVLRPHYIHLSITIH
jgi:hypothetical protein